MALRLTIEPRPSSHRKPEGPPKQMGTKLTKTQDTVLNGIIRHILTAAGGALVTKGMIAQTELELVVGAVIAIAGHGRCLKCGCSRAKLFLKTSKCPVGKW